MCAMHGYNGKAIASEDGLNIYSNCSVKEDQDWVLVRNYSEEAACSSDS